MRILKVKIGFSVRRTLTVKTKAVNESHVLFFLIFKIIMIIPNLKCLPRASKHSSLLWLFPTSIPGSTDSKEMVRKLGKA